MIIKEKLHLAKDVYIPTIPTDDTELIEYLEFANSTAFDGLINIHSARFNKRLKVCAGRCYSDNRIEMNPHIDDPIQFLNTALHELAHAYDFQFYGDSNHGDRWQGIFQIALNKWGLDEFIEVSRCHNYETLKKKSTKRPKTRYYCPDTTCAGHDKNYRVDKRTLSYFTTYHDGFVPCPVCKSKLSQKVVY